MSLGKSNDVVLSFMNQSTSFLLTTLSFFSFFFFLNFIWWHQFRLQTCGHVG
jgi:hypothetical protein